MPTHQELLEYYTHPAAMTSAGDHAPEFDRLPCDVASLTGVVQGLLLHEHLVADYGVVLSDERRSEVHFRTTEQRLACLRARNDRPLSVARPVEARLIGNCRHYTVLLVAMLRAHGVPSRARCGFGAYFEAGRFVDHWVCEYWNAVQGRWMLVDAQLDELQQAKFAIDFDVLDVPRDRFLVAGEAWAQCRAGTADPPTFGILDMSGLWFVAGNVVRDLAALNNMEMLPWDVWGAMPLPDESMPDEQLVFFDRLATLSREPDRSFTELRTLYTSDDRLRVPATIFNAVLNRSETI